MPRRFYIKEDLVIMGFILGSLQLGIMYGLLAAGIFISFRILNIPDLTAEGSFGFGLCVSAMITIAGHPYLALIAGMAAGALAGTITGLLHTKCEIHPILAGILTMTGLYSINLFVMKNSSNVSLINMDTVFTDAYALMPFLSKEWVKLIIVFIFTAIPVAALAVFFKTRMGLSIRATGDNEVMVRASSINVNKTKIGSLAISNACIALNGAVLAQYQNYADINIGSGMLIVGLASVIIGEAIFSKRGVTIGLISAVAGSAVYRIIMAVATKYIITSSAASASSLKLVSAIIVGVALSVPAIKKAVSRAKAKKGGPFNA